MKAGLLRHPVALQRRDLEPPNEVGEQLPRYTEYARSWASVHTLTAYELERARQVYAEATHRVELRYVAGVKATDRLSLDGRIMEVLGIDNVDQRNIRLILVCKEIIE